MSTAPHTLEELLIARMSKEFRGEVMGVGATILSDLSARLAKALYVPELYLTTQSRAAADCGIHPKSMSDEWILAQSAQMTLNWEEMFQLVAQNRLQIWMGAVQIDRTGASNISVVGSWDKPRIALIGARGVPDDLWGCERLCYHMRVQNTRSFVEKVDFLCAFGYGPDYEKWGRRTSKPGIIVSDLGVYNIDPETASMRIVSLHPGVGFDDAQKKTGFPLQKPAGGTIPVTAEPTAEELAIIREVIDPLGMRRLESKEATEELSLEIWRNDPGSASGRNARA
jgi:glutaconate CoA-transferase, subunit B